MKVPAVAKMPQAWQEEKDTEQRSGNKKKPNTFDILSSKPGGDSYPV
jgi:hypothetical protein